MQNYADAKNAVVQVILSRAQEAKKDERREGS
jgi:hypothetical protein